MKEILYIQAGSQANYIGTHFWNTQETYLAFEDPEHSYIQHDVSFAEIKQGSLGPSTYCPRAILFDRKSNFGRLAKINALGREDTDVADFNGLWSGDVLEYRQDVIPKSKYHAELEETDKLITEAQGCNTSPLHQSNDIRYWSDFSRVYYNPRSIQSLPDPSYGEIIRGDWKAGHELFHRFNEETSLMDDSVRPFLEECDFFQGLQVSNDVETFGGFTNAFLTTFRDEFSKASSLVIPILSNAQLESCDAQVTTTVVNDALYLRSLREVSSLVLPILNPSTWPSDSWNHLVNFDKQNVYQSSAIVSTHIETCTLPLRLNGSRQDLPSFCAQSKRYGADVFCQFSGYAPVSHSTPLDRQRFNFSDKESLASVQEWSRTDITRGFSPPLLSIYDKWRLESMRRGTAVSTVHALAHPLPSSYPAIFRESNFAERPYGGKNAPPAVSAISSISTGTGTAKLFSTYAQLIKNALRAGKLNSSVGFETDDMRELVDDLWALHDRYVDDDVHEIG